MTFIPVIARFHNCFAKLVTASTGSPGPSRLSTRRGFKREFVWEGLDGSEVLSSYGPYGFGALKRIDDINNYRKDWKAAVVALYESAVKGPAAE